jgi:hypothetical protein
MDLSGNLISKDTFEGLATMLDNCFKLVELNLAGEASRRRISV